MSVQRLSNTEIVTLAVYLLGGESQAVEVEDIAVKVNDLAPGRFTWRKHKNQINLDAVRKRLWDAKNKDGFLSGSERSGWLVTESGLRFALARVDSLPEMDLAREPLGRQEQQWRRRAPDDLVGVVVERDHGGASATVGRLATKVTEQVRVSAMEPVEHADHDEQSTMCGGQPVDALDDIHGLLVHAGPGSMTAAARSPCRASPPPASTKTLSGASRSPLARATATSVSSGPTSR